jgi:lipopolysaccharide/colanic/teichoic acid biosynthesis glycosyltransferase
LTGDVAAQSARVPVTTAAARAGNYDDALTRRWSRLRPASKRVFDVVVGSLTLIIVAPVLVGVAVAVLVSDGRPVIYRQTRVGRHGLPFTMFKFRSMVTDAHARLHEVQDGNQRTGPLFKLDDDPRVTRVGQFLRVTSLDELPQLFNVIGGSMSLVGPRPALHKERESFPPELLEREALRPGITGRWQIEARLEPSFDRYRHLDLLYVRTYTLWGDLEILLRTPAVVVRDAWRDTRAVREGSRTRLPAQDASKVADGSID